MVMQERLTLVVEVVEVIGTLAPFQVVEQVVQVSWL